MHLAVGLFGVPQWFVRQFRKRRRRFVGCARSRLDDELVGDCLRRMQARQRPFGGLETRLADLFGEHLVRDVVEGVAECLDRIACRRQQGHQRLVCVEMQVGPVEQAGVFVRQLSLQQFEADRSVCAVGHGREQAAAGLDAVAQAGQKSLRILQVFDDVGTQDDIEAGITQAGLPVGRLHVDTQGAFAVRRGLAQRRLLDVHTEHTTAFLLCEMFGHVAGRAAEFQHLGAGRHACQQLNVRVVLRAELQRMLVFQGCGPRILRIRRRVEFCLHARFGWPVPQGDTGPTVGLYYASIRQLPNRRLRWSAPKLFDSRHEGTTPFQIREGAGPWRAEIIN